MSCQICGSVEKLQIHHDSYDPEITRILCVSCHQDQHETHGVGLGVGWSSKFLENKDEFSRLLDNGFTYNELMNRFDISYVTVYNWANRLDKRCRQTPIVYKYTSDGVMECWNCDNSDLRKYGFNITKKGKFQVYQCKNCGATMSDKTPIARASEES